MRHAIILTGLLFCPALLAQTEVRNSSWTFSNGIHPTFSVTFLKTDAGTVEKWFKDRLDAISEDVTSKKELLAVGTRLPEVSGDTIRVLARIDQQKKSPDVTIYLAFLVNNTYVSPDSEKRQHEGCRDWIYQNAVMLKKELTQKEVTAATKQLSTRESELAGLIKEKDRAQKSIEKTQQNITEDEQEKVNAEGRSTTMTTAVDAKRQEVANAPSEANMKELQELMKENEKLKRRAEKLTKDIADGRKKIEDLQFAIKENLAEQDAKARAIDAQRKVVEDLTAKLANIN